METGTPQIVFIPWAGLPTFDATPACRASTFLQILNPLNPLASIAALKKWLFLARVFLQSRPRIFSIKFIIHFFTLSGSAPPSGSG